MQSARVRLLISVAVASIKHIGAFAGTRATHGADVSITTETEPVLAKEHALVQQTLDALGEIPDEEEPPSAVLWGLGLLHELHEAANHGLTDQQVQALQQKVFEWVPDAVASVVEGKNKQIAELREAWHVASHMGKARSNGEMKHLAPQTMRDLLLEKYAEHMECLDKAKSNGEATHFSEQDMMQEAKGEVRKKDGANADETQYFSAMSEREDGANADDLSSSEQFFSAMPEREDETYSTPSEPSGPVYTDHLTDSRKVPEQISAL
mmetsp:Transcript_101796/g.311316  ORF Transcript_101796/g.311316 Transcript_101796/m.311316 type:complete len:266 (-) Transcript_101796:128-925(-)